MIRPLAQAFRRAKLQWRARRATAEIARRPATHRPHGLNRRLIVSLTSYPARFDVLALTLTGLLRQTVRPDAVVLWLAHDDIPLLPPEVTALTAQGLQVRGCADLRSYKKIIPALAAFPDSLIVTADDDVYYWHTWLAELVSAYQTLGAPVICHRGRRIAVQADGTPAPYRQWRKVTGQASGPLILPTGVHGVLYDPAILHPDVADVALFQSLAPTSDDLWLYFMHRRCGSKPVCLGLDHRVLEWPGSQTTRLQAANTAQDGNDRALARLIAQFGFPAD